MTGRGEGYCVLELPGSGQPSRGYAGLEGVPVHLEPPVPNLGSRHQRPHGLSLFSGADGAGRHVEGKAAGFPDDSATVGRM
jgi:hypothetical protein